MIVETMYSGRVLNNSHRGDFVEMMVLDALGDAWRHVGLGWNLWDLQRGSGPDRIRIQVKQCAALQLWGKTKRMTIQTPYATDVPAYFVRDFPNEAIEGRGYRCEIFVIGVHRDADPATCDQTNPLQWQFLGSSGISVGMLYP